MNLVAVLLFLWSLQTYANNQTEIPITYSVTHIQNTLSEGPKHQERLFEKLGMDHHAGARYYLNNYIDMSDYVLVQTTDGTLGFILKDRLPGYKAQFDRSMIQTAQAASWLRRKFTSGYEVRSGYFADKFSGARPTRVFHCFGNYRYPGFREYVKKLPGFDDFILSIGEQLKPGSAFHKKLTKSDNLQDFAALKDMHQAKIRELEQKAQAKHQADLRKILSARDFSDHGIKLLEHNGIESQFLYDGNLQQLAQLKNITSFINDVGEFRHEYHKTPELNEISDSATGFGILANNANRENLPGTSQAFLEIGQNLLALGRGLINGCERNVSGIYHMVRHPINTFVDIGTLAANIGIGIGNVASLVPRFGMGLILDDQAIIQSVQQDVNHYCDDAKQIYQYIDRAWQDKTTAERYELAGSLMVDLLLMKGLPAASPKLATIKNLSRYKPQAFSKLGNIGREINETVGLICAKSRDYLRRGEQVVMAGEAEFLVSEGLGFAREIETGLNAVKQDITVSSSAHNLAKVAQFETGITKLAATYGVETVEEARMALRINEYKLAKNCENKLLQELENTCANIKKVKTKPHRHNFIYFVDELGREWDVKTGYSSMINSSTYRFNLNRFMFQVENAFTKGKNIILDITQLNEGDLNSLKSRVTSLISNLESKSEILYINRLNCDASWLVGKL